MLNIKAFLLVTTCLFAVVLGERNTILDVIRNTPELSIFNTLVSTPGNEHLYDLLSRTNNRMTVFAPVNNAFHRLYRMIRRANVHPTEREAKMVLYNHVVPRQIIRSSDLYEGYQQYPTLYNYHFEHTSHIWEGRGHFEAPQNLTNGLIIYGKAGQYAIYRGLGVPANFVRNDIRAANGMIHIVDRVLVPPLTFFHTLELRDLTRVLDSINRANAFDTFQSFWNVTYLIPNNRAVERFTAAYVDLSPQSLREVLLTHVIPGIYFSQDLASDSVYNLVSKSGERLQFNNPYGRERLIGDAIITRPDILTDSGVFHEIDRVIVPTVLQREPIIKQPRSKE